MKATEAPEKIILTADRETGTLYDERVIKDTADDIKIEYIRTDAFIEKVANYIANNMRCNGYTLQAKTKFIRDFEKYMKEE